MFAEISNIPRPVSDKELLYINQTVGGAIFRLSLQIGFRYVTSISGSPSNVKVSAELVQVHREQRIDVPATPQKMHSLKIVIPDEDVEPPRIALPAPSPHPASTSRIIYGHTFEGRKIQDCLDALIDFFSADHSLFVFYNQRSGATPPISAYRYDPSQSEFVSDRVPPSKLVTLTP